MGASVRSCVKFDVIEMFGRMGEKGQFDNIIIIRLMCCTKHQHSTFIIILMPFCFCYQHLITRNGSMHSKFRMEWIVSLLCIVACSEK